jgi:hypothetical protein
MSRLESLATYRTMLRVQKHRLDDELEVNAEIYDHIGQQLTKATSRMNEAKEELARVEARVTQEARDSFEGKRVAKDDVVADVKRNRDYRSAYEQYQLARHDHEEWESLYRAWAQRGKDIDLLGRLYGNQYWTLDSVQRERKERREPPPASVEEASERREEPQRRQRRGLML